MVGQPSPRRLPIRLLTSPHDPIISNRWRSPQANSNTPCDGTSAALHARLTHMRVFRAGDPRRVRKRQLGAVLHQQQSRSRDVILLGLAQAAIPLSEFVCVLDAPIHLVQYIPSMEYLQEQRAPAKSPRSKEPRQARPPSRSKSPRAYRRRVAATRGAAPFPRSMPTARR